MPPLIKTPGISLPSARSTKPALTPNNFNLIRLVAAFQVAFYHAASQSGLRHEEMALVRILNYFPGVPIFFFVSGFLISHAYERNPDRFQYVRNRVLRLYPALFVCTSLTLLALFAVGYLDAARVTVLQAAAWFVSQVTFVQFYNPDFFRAFGVGVVNGSLWTICVELQFYCAVPVLYRLLRRVRRPGLVLGGLTIAFLALNRVYFHVQAGSGESLAVKLAGVSFLPWFYMFLTGVLVQRHRAVVHKIAAGRVLPITAVYLAFAILGKEAAGWSLGNFITPAIFFALALCIYSVAFSARSISDRFIKADLSYGLYIYHMPVINVLIFCGWYGGANAIVWALGVAFCLAAFSWYAVEKPALSRKSSNAKAANESLVRPA